MQRLYRYFSFIQHPAVQPWLKRLAVVTPAIFTLLLIMLIRSYFGRFGIHIPPQISFASLVPVAFMLWLSTWDNGTVPRAMPSVWSGMLVFPIIMAAAVAAAYPLWEEYRAFTTLAAIMASILFYTGIKQPLAAMRAEPAAAILCILLGSILYLHGFLHENFWAVLCESTANVITAITKLLGYDVLIRPAEGNVIYLTLDHYSLMLAPPCSGMDGIAIFFGLLTMVFLLDWPMFRSFPFARLYVAGFFLMFMVNALRILALFSAGAMGADPHAPQWARSLQQASMDMFHEHIGWTIYVIVFAIFVAPLYRKAYAQESSD